MFSAEMMVRRVEVWADRVLSDIQKCGEFGIISGGSSTEKPFVEVYLNGDVIIDIMLWTTGECEFSYVRGSNVRDEHFQASSLNDLDLLLRRFELLANGGDLAR